MLRPAVRFSALLAIVFATLRDAPATSAQTADGTVDGPSRTVAFCNFTTSTFSYRDTTDAQTLSDLVQAGLAAESPDGAYAWLDRSEIDAALNELELTSFAGNASATSLRIGKWLKADYLVKGVVGRGSRDSKRLQLEIIDLDRADVLAARTLTLECDAGGRLSLAESNVRRTLSAVEAALDEAQTRNAASLEQVLIAPLDLRNAESTSRLDFLAADILQRLQRRNREQDRVRYLQFPRSHDAIDEANLMASGLVASDSAWQRVADYYVWGEYRELDAAGREFAEVEVEITLEIWDGRHDVKRVVERSQVNDLPTLVDRLAVRIEELAQSKDSGPVRDNLRQQIAEQIRTAAAELQEWVVQVDRGDFSRPADEWLRLWRQSLRLLSVAAFFDPTNERIRRELLIETTRDDLNFATLPGNQEFWRLWNRSDAWKSHCQQFGYDYEHVHMPELKSRPGLADNRLFYGSALITYVTTAKDVLVVANRQQLPAEGGPPPDAPDDILDQWRAALKSEYLDRVRFAVSYSPKLMGEHAQQHLFLCLAEGDDDQLRADVIQSLWPLLLNDATFQVRKYENGINSVFKKIGKPDVAASLIAEAHRRGRGAPSPKTATRRARPAAKPPAQAPAALAPLASVPIRTISLDRHFYTQRVTAIEYAGGRLWVGLMGQFRTTRQGYALFTCDAAGDDVRLFPKINPSETHVTAIELDGHALWLATDGDGVCRLDLKTDELRKFGARDGLPSQKIYALANSGPTLYAAGGAEERGMLASLGEGARSWTQHELSELEFFGRTIPTSRVMELASDGRWLAAFSHRGGSMAQLLVRKQAGGAWIDAGAALHAAHPQFSRDRRDGAPAVSGLFFAGDELWILTEFGLLAYHPNSNAPSFAARVPYELTAGVRVGDRLWIAAKPSTPNSTGDPSAKDACLLGFNLKSRQWEWQLELQRPGTVFAMVLREDRLWLGLGGKGATVAVIDAEALSGMASKPLD